MPRIPDFQIDFEQRRHLDREVGELRHKTEVIAQRLTDMTRENARLRDALLAAGFEPGVVDKIAKGEV